MSSPKIKAEFISCRYTRSIRRISAPTVINKLIQSYYDIYFYRQINKNLIQRFFKTNNGDTILAKLITKIKGIGFGYLLYPNGSTAKSKGCVELGIIVTNIPSDIEYFSVAIEGGCDTTSTNDKGVVRWHKNYQFFVMEIAKLSDCKNMTQMDLYFNIDVIEIKYKADKKDYKLKWYMSMNYQYEWKIDNKAVISGMRGLKNNKLLCSDNFNNNNWCIAIPAGQSHDKFKIKLKLLRYPYKLSAFSTIYTLRVETASGKQYDLDTGMCRFERREWNVKEKKAHLPYSNVRSIQFNDVTLNELAQEEWFKICIKMRSKLFSVGHERWENDGVY